MKQDNAPVKAESYCHILFTLKHRQQHSGWKRSNNNAEGLHSNLTQSII